MIHARGSALCAADPSGINLEKDTFDWRNILISNNVGGVNQVFE